MPKRVFWLLVTAVFPILALSSLSAVPGLAQTAVPQTLHDAIINEWSQGSDGSKEWVEIVVVNGPVDMRGWDLGDSSAGDLAFSDNALWENVPAGSLIVIYNGSDPAAELPPDDTDLTDYGVVIPHNNAAYFSGSWPLFSNSTSDDNPQVRDSAAAVIHDFSAEPGGGLHPGSQESVRFDGDSENGVGDPANWTRTTYADVTPGAGNGGANSAWIAALRNGGSAPAADLAVVKDGPVTAVSGESILYQINLSNQGSLTATAVILTDTLPISLTYAGDDSGFPLEQPGANRLVWSVGALPTDTSISFHLTATIDIGVSGLITNEIAAATAVTETNLSNNRDTAVTAVGDGTTPIILIDAVLYDGYENGDESVLLRNVGGAVADLGGWQISDNEATTAVLPPGVSLAPGARIWIAKDAAAFTRQFGFAPDIVPDDWPLLADYGDEVVLLDASDAVVDALVYEDGDTGQAGWSGTAVYPYSSGGLFGQDGQILYRRRDQATGLPVPDTDTAADWAQMTDDVINGRKPRYPGWDLDEFFFTAQVTETAVLTVAIAPDNAYQAIVNEINRAQTSLHIESHTFENIAIADALIQAAQRGVSVTVLLEGSPPGGIEDQQKYVCQQLEAANAHCWFMISDSGHDIFDRYRYLHAKFILIDGQKVIISSENLSPNSLPDDDKSDGTWGRRGVVLITDAPGVVGRVQTIFERDFDLTNHVDITGTAYIGPPPPNFVPITETGGITYAVRFTEPAVFSGDLAFELVQSPENSLRDRDGLLGLLNRAGAGDTILMEQLGERPYWGDNSADDPNPRLEAAINAARRGADVRLLLDAYFDDGGETSNTATCQYVRAIAQSERLALDCALNNPTGLGIHNKMVLARINGKGYIHIGSINGSEQSNKGNRELALQVQSDGAYDLLAGMFYGDWPYRAYLPVTLNNYIGPANHILISEILYNPLGDDDKEFIELVNPTPNIIDLSDFSLGDAVNRDDYEDVRRFPAGTMLAPDQLLVIATTAPAFQAEFGFNPDFEIYDLDPAVPDLIDDAAWGDPGVILQLGNSGDEVILRDVNDHVVDAVTYGTGNYPGVTACELVTIGGASLERDPYWRDTDDCLIDFRENPFPTPGAAPD